MYNPTENLQNMDKTPLNFVLAGSNKVFINEIIDSYTCSHLIADMTLILDIPGNNFLEIFINSSGGEWYTGISIINMMEIAKEKGLTVNTYVTGEAASMASMIALYGDNRFIHKNARHMIHFGTYWNEVHKETEIKKSLKDMQEFHDNCIDIYSKKTKMKKAFIEKIMEDEFGYMNAEDCIKYGIATQIVGE